MVEYMSNLMEVKKIFAVSDVHGFFSELKTALVNAGFMENNPNHLLVFCGDMFDRGKENLAVFRYFSKLENKILIRGNHDERLSEILESRQLEECDFQNHTDETLKEFFGERCIDDNLQLVISDEVLAEKLKELYQSELNYFELGNYIFTHGWLPSDVIENKPYLLDDWRNASDVEWSFARWLEWQQMYTQSKTTLIQGKILVCGHRPSSFGYMFDRSRIFDDYGIFYGDGLIAIDGWTVHSGIVNVLVIEPGKHLVNKNGGLYEKKDFCSI